ncbi:hypothetical protein Poli38472_001497 [Pythium oligandrum]|uniref:ER membrane protein complex subunit 7 beta-sandwich domain-containing protein n=1 Tax=Pythium oligandrum TaxID=41045 RepID=A0A8K1CVE9_PYTOL|nr:hypothetical protein Poli38472_001497 [Pythium oligandrum]|eukprot:TMW69341.1 hypothetical protein Poli38472_001497 [Pythium oligandrum]
MTMLRVVQAALVALAALVVGGSSAYEIKGTVFIGEAEKVAPYRILLNGGEQVTYARADGAFVFRDITPGRYVIDIPAEDRLFSQYKVDIAEDGVVRAIEYQYPGAPKARAEYPLAVEPVAEFEYFEEREKFSILQLIMNPSFLTIIVPVGLLYLLPKLSEAMMDPEEFKKAQEEMGTQDPSALLQGMFGGGQQTADDSDDD